MKLYHEVRGCSLAVDIVARELQLPLALEWVDMKTKRLEDGRDYFSVNSKGTVPTLEMPDGQHLSEGCIVMQYLADQCPGNTLLPAAGLPRYRVLEWMSFIAADLHKGGFMPLFKAVTPPEYKAIARRIVEAKLQWVDEQLAGRSFLTGEHFTIADAHCYTIAMWTRAHAIDTQGWPRLEAYLARCGARPSVRAAEAAAAAQGVRERERAAARAAAAPAH
ncbi:glutathione transferase GstA [uncultured Pseudacidovorax sp.]|uniref:glutathione transferase GstA n=1 Tax=uncultured Pseudacidovorax sp. TaxID=679313 RepID=UPI0025CC0058|nr:glutathione transferase GstA [uncultured Pseudacidovorax sp.]